MLLFTLLLVYFTIAVGIDPESGGLVQRLISQREELVQVVIMIVMMVTIMIMMAMIIIIMVIVMMAVVMMAAIMVVMMKNMKER